MSLFDELMEMVIDDRPVATLDESVVLAEMNEEIDDMLWGLNESVSDSISKVLDKFNSIGGTNLKKEDLSDINKVKSAVSKMESVKSQNKKMLAKYCVSFFLLVLMKQQKWILLLSWDLLLILNSISLATLKL